LITTKQKQPTTQFPSLPLDVTLDDLKKSLAADLAGVTVATLYLQERSGSGVLFPGSMSMPNVTSRPTFPLSPSATEFDHLFPQINNYDVTINPASPTGGVPYIWMLDFTQGGKRRGVVMSQSRMKAIELVVNPLGNMSAMGDTTAAGSWIDLLVGSAGFSSSALTDEVV
jgi:hypothetical protein